MKDYKKLKKIFADDKDMLRTLQNEENAELMKELISETSKKSAVELKAEFIKGDKGEKPVKGVDYLTDDELEQIKKQSTPIKGEDYFTNDEVSQIIEIAAEKATPVKGRDYFDGEKGRNADESKIVAKLSKLIPTSEEIASQVKMPDIEEIAKDILSRVPKNEEVPTIEDIIKELKKGKWLETKDIKGMPLNMNDLRWHGSGLTDAPSDDIVYSRRNGAWVNEITVSTTAPASPYLNQLWLDIT